MQVLLVFPHQLFEGNARLAASLDGVYLVEEPLLFLQYRFHQQKLVLHRASLQAHAHALRAQGLRVEYVTFDECPSTAELFSRLSAAGVNHVHYVDVVDDWLEQRIRAASAACAITLARHRTPMFLSAPRLLKSHFGKPGNARMAAFYQDQRRERDILMDGTKPVGGRWSFDEDNRKKLPRSVAVPARPGLSPNAFVLEAQAYVGTHFAGNPGRPDPFCYPVTPADARQWLGEFLEARLPGFGAYEDALSQQHDVLFHSVLTPMLNIGLLTPVEVIDRALVYRDRVPLNSLEGFIRQVVGWREYMRGAYVSKGRRQRSANFWKHTRPIPDSFWTGNTGIAPLDHVIRKLLRYAYAHHIERLMVLSNFMLLCEFDPDQVYRWFMEMFIDAYDWVMVPNVYAMALYADGGGITTKPYISGSNYLLKMSDFDKGEWCAIWDGLYWRFMHDTASSSPRIDAPQVLVLGLDRLSPATRARTWRRPGSSCRAWTHRSGKPDGAAGGQAVSCWPDLPARDHSG